MLILTPKWDSREFGGNLLVPYKMNKAQLFLVKYIFIDTATNIPPPLLSEPQPVCLRWNIPFSNFSAYSLTEFHLLH